MTKHIIIFSHGFGVHKDDKGLLTDIAAACSEAEPWLFDYNEVNEQEKTIMIRTLKVQSAMLRDCIADVLDVNPEAIVDLVCHSQGCAIAGFIQPKGVRKILLLTPVFDMSLERTLRRYEHNPEAHIDLSGVSEIPPLEGYRRFVPAEYWAERKTTDMFSLYNKLANKSEVALITANQDQVLPSINLQELSPAITTLRLDGDHNFSDNARGPLLDAVKELLQI